MLLPLSLCTFKSVQKVVFFFIVDDKMQFALSECNLVTKGECFVSTKSPNKKPGLALIGATALRNNKALLAAITQIKYFPEERIGHRLLLLDCRSSSPSLVKASAVLFFIYLFEISLFVFFDLLASDHQALSQSVQLWSEFF